MRVVDSMWQMLAKQKHSAVTGVLSMLGFEPTHRFGSTTRFNWLGSTFDVAQGAMPEMRPHLKRDATFSDYLSAGAGIGTTAFMMGGGFMEGGIWGMAQSMIWETSIQGALVKNAYTKLSSANGVDDLVMGSSFLGKIATRRGWTNTGTALNWFDYSKRSMAGQGAATLVSGLLGHGIVGTIAGTAAAGMGAKHANKFLIGAAIYKLGSVTAGGAYSVVKGTLNAGYNHAQMKKEMHTSGNMAAFHTQGAFTMRERAVMAMQRSHLNARSALGQEASYMHSPSRNYHSRYY